jgi:hypothetical protein
MKRIVALALAGSLALVVPLVVPAGAALAGDRDVIREGSCSGRSDWKLKLSPEDGGIEAEFEVDQNLVGVRWRVRIVHDGQLAFRGTRTTRGASGSFGVRIVENDTAGADAFRARARNLSTGEACAGRASI